MSEKRHRIFKAPKGHRHKGIRKSPTVREFLWRLFARGISLKRENRAKIAEMVNEKFKGLRVLHPEYKMVARSVDYHICIWRKTLKINQQAWRKM